jgi:preprotein translocase subunit SecA
VEKSERLSGILKKMGVKHEVLNAKNHEREASIVAQAGRKGAVTVSTNMAGRGTDILLGGNPEFLLKERLTKAGKSAELLLKLDLDAEFEAIRQQVEAERAEVVAAGGLHILGTERHESRRIDNQLRGRAGRQGDPGSSRFYLSLQDDLLRIFGGERMQGLMLRLGMEEDMPIESGLITKRIAAAQKAVEAQNFASRKHVLEYDDVMNKQRQAVYSMRRQLIEGQSQKEKILEIVTGIVAQFIDACAPEGAKSYNYDLPELQNSVLNQFGMRVDTDQLANKTREELESYLNDLLARRYEEKEQVVGADNMREAERIIMLNVIDNQWKDHLLSMDHLKEGIGLRSYGQKDPLIEYKKESFKMFQDMMDRIEDETIRYLYFLRIEMGPPGEVQGGRPNVPLPYPELEEEEDENPLALPEPEPEMAGVSLAHRQAAQNTVLDITRNIHRKKEREMSALQFAGGEAPSKPQTVTNAAKVGRNDPCPCGSGKKYKKCHGA